jgi:c-di-GMP-related signal transduction protein
LGINGLNFKSFTGDLEGKETKQMQVVLARQPIFDRSQKVFAYELLYRSGVNNRFEAVDMTQASLKVLVDSCLVIGIENITGGKRAFFNVTEEFLLKDYAALLPKDLTVLELHNEIQPTHEIMEICKNLKNQGYQLALDNFVYEDKYLELLKRVNLVKIDFLNVSKEDQKRTIEKTSVLGIPLVALKIESWEAFQEAIKMGYTYFQGFFFSKPMLMTGKEITGLKLHYFRLLKEIHQPSLDMAQIEAIIKRDVSLAYKLLRYINSAIFNRRSDINSIKQALMLLGEKEVKKWATLIAMVNLGQSKPEELVVQSMIRAKFCESLASRSGLSSRADDAFMMGMFSLVDALSDQPLQDILKDIPIKDDVKSALLGGSNRLRDIYEYVLAYERGDWAKFSDSSTKLGIEVADLLQLYMDAVEWAHKSFQKGPLAE